MKISIGVIIPALNEEKNIEAIVSAIANVLAQTEYTICIVDDGSIDKTIAIIQRLMDENPRIHLIQRVKERSGCQRGGASFVAMKWLVENTTHQIFTEVDADGAHRPEELLNGAHCLATLGYDVAIASKYVYGSKVAGRSWVRNFVSGFYSHLARLLFDRRIRDYSNSFRFYSRSAANCVLDLRPRYTSPIYLLEALVMWIANDFKIIELSTQYIERQENASKVIFKDLVKGFLCALAIGVRYRLRKYNRKDAETSLEVESSN